MRQSSIRGIEADWLTAHSELMTAPPKQEAPPPLLYPDYQLCLAYARASERDVLTALFRIDSFLGRIALSAREPMIARIKLAWWREQGFGAAGLATELADEIGLLVQHHPDALIGLKALADAWDDLVDCAGSPLNDVLIGAGARGQSLFALALSVSAKPIDDAGRDLAKGWSAANLGRGLGRADMLAKARSHFAAHSLRSLGKACRPLAVLSALTRSDAQRGLGGMSAYGSPSRMLIAFRTALLKN